ncbi:MAG: ion transporter [Oscillospiraceae bacterium]|nr:ion transporter [Oscillospiraceae bacterium]
MKKHIFRIIQIGSKEDLPSRLFDFFIVTCIFANITIAFLYTYSELEPFKGVLSVLEAFTVMVFIVEYMLRLWTADLLYPEYPPGKARLKFLTSFDGVIDLMTILPFFFLSGFIVFRMLRVVRIFRLFRINSQYDSFNVITTVILEKKNQILSSIFIILILMLASSLGMYNAEHEAQPDVFRNGFSGIWWSVSTLLTVGYGDIYPITTVGKIMAIFIAFLGVGAVAVPTGIISAGFVEQYTKKQYSDISFTDIKEIGEIIADEENGLSGITVGQASADFDLHIYVILRGELTVVASESIKIQKGDVLVAGSKKIVK